MTCRRWLVCVLLPLCARAEDVPLNPDRLWLPKSQTQHQRLLLQAADVALAGERCTEGLRGQLDQRASQPDEPVFAIVCRDQNRRSYVEKFSGLELQRLTDDPPEPVPEPAVDLTSIEQAVYGRCQQLWLEKTAVLNGVQWLDGWHDWRAQSAQTVDLADGRQVEQYHYQREFDAVNQDGVALYYSALCDGHSVEALWVKILPRRSVD